MPATAPASPRHAPARTDPAASRASDHARRTPPSVSPAAGLARRPERPGRDHTPLGRARSWLRPADREVLWLYLLTRVALWTTAYCTRLLFPANGDARVPEPVLTSLERWDWGHFLHIARDGYFPDEAGAGPGPGTGDNREAFFPGFPLLLRAVHTVVPDWTVAGLLISFVAGAVAVVALARIAELHLAHTHAGRRAALFLLLSPCAVFLAAGYSEALFLAFALPAWLAAQRHQWPLAALLAAGATTVRVSGLFLAAALAVHFLLTVRTGRRRAALLTLPALPALLYFWYLYERTGDWMAWKHAQERGWYRHFRAPWDAWSQTWHEAFAQTQATGYAALFQADLAAMLLGLGLLALLIRRRRWPEAVYIALTLWALGTSYWYMSIARSTLLWWPLWIGLAAWSLRGRRTTAVYVCLAAPLGTVLTVTFLTGRWAG
ncbi:mannosyltransferase family protein [Streptomyces sp. NPDC006477]|uniref:mannosyltransferase family protein n=1 Tax=Streptomyces sp. NPDC006477 TaxID=3364747 RepID=UPI0036A7A4E4